MHAALFYDVSARVETFYYKSNVTFLEMERSRVVSKIFSDAWPDNSTD